MSQRQGQLSRCRRGVFGLDSWEPLRRPGSTVKSEPAPTQSSNINNNSKTLQKDQGRTQPVPNRAPTKPGKPVMAKYSYTANPNSPLGKELTMKQGEQLILSSGVNELWWLARNQNNEEGYVPASYLVVIEEKSAGLPWLQNRTVEEPQPNVINQEPMTTAFGRPDTSCKTAMKEYQSAYNRQQKDKKKWHCELCNKTLNGPQPYRAHMNSKDHKAEEEYTREEGRL